MAGRETAKGGGKGNDPEYFAGKRSIVVQKGWPGGKGGGFPCLGQIG